MKAIVTAGGITLPDDPLYQLTGVAKKALIPLRGKPMISWVIEALLASAQIEDICVVGLQPSELKVGDAPVHFVDGVGGMIDNLLVGLEYIQSLDPTVQKILLSSSDIPLITAAIVRGFIEECGSQEGDVYYSIVAEETLEKQFPHSRRTFIPFRGGRFTGGDFVLVDATVPTKVDLDLFRALSDSRKNYWRQARMLGFGFIVRFLLRRMTVYEAAERGSKIFNLDAHVVNTRFAEIGMDLDKPRHYNIIKAELEKREAMVRND